MTGPWTAAEIKAYVRMRVKVSKITSGEARGPCPIHGSDGSGDNFSIKMATGEWYCHSVCKKGGGLPALEMAITGKDKKEAFEAVCRLVGRKDTNGFEVCKYVYTDADGKPLHCTVRYEPKGFSQRSWDGRGWVGSLDGVPTVLYRLPEVLKADQVLIVEGEKDADALEQLGFVATTNPMGAGKWKRQYNQSLKGKDVIVIPDPDKPGQDHARDIIGNLSGRVRRLRVLTVPVGKDAYEWIADGASHDEIQAAIDAAPEAIAQPEPEPESPPPPPPVDENLDKPQFSKKKGRPKKDASASGGSDLPSPNLLAERIMDEHDFLTTHEDKTLWKYNGAFWDRSSSAEIHSICIQREGLSSVASRRGEAVGYIKGSTFHKKIPWNQVLKPSEIPMLDGVLNVETMQLRPHRKEDWLDNAIPHKWDKEASCSLWMETLESFFSDSDDAAEKALLLQEYAGYCLTAERPRFALLIEGPKDCGKSVVYPTFRAIVGEDACCSIRLEDMSDSRRLAPIVAKRLNTLAEISQRGWIADAGFNALLGGNDTVQVDPKFIAQYDVVPMARHLIMTNKLPTVSNTTGSVFKRIIILKMTRQFTAAEQDRHRADRLRAELPGIVNWAVSGAVRLYRNGGKFTIPESSRKAHAEYVKDQNPMEQFIEERCYVDPDAKVPRSAFYSAFRQWIGRDEMRNKEIRDMIPAGFEITPDKVRYAPWDRTEVCVLGLKLIGPVPPKPE